MEKEETTINPLQADLRNGAAFTGFTGILLVALYRSLENGFSSNDLAATFALTLVWGVYAYAYTKVYKSAKNEAKSLGWDRKRFRGVWVRIATTSLLLMGFLTWLVTS